MWGFDMSTRTEYLNPLFDRFGAHQGLNADWNTMAWPVGFGDLWILDDESPEETVSMVKRCEQEDGSVEIEEALTLLVPAMLVQVDQIRNRAVWLAEWMRIHREIVAKNPTALRTGLGQLPSFAQQMMYGLLANTSSNEGPVTKAVCKYLKIKNTYKAIQEFLNGGAR